MITVCNSKGYSVSDRFDAMVQRGHGAHLETHKASNTFTFPLAKIIPKTTKLLGIANLESTRTGIVF